MLKSAASLAGLLAALDRKIEKDLTHAVVRRQGEEVRCRPTFTLLSAAEIPRIFAPLSKGVRQSFAR